MSKRIHELAKEWSVQPKDLVAGLEKLGIRGKRSQSSLTDEEVQRVREALRLVSRPTGAGGTQRGVAERGVTQRDPRGGPPGPPRAPDDPDPPPPGAGPP